LRQQSNSAQQLIAVRDVKLAEAGSRLAIKAADVTRLSEALRASEDTKGKLQEMANGLRAAHDQDLQLAAQSSQQISDLTNMLERNGGFLGKLTIDTVELNEATGRISGPADKVGNVRQGVEVKTQL